MQQTQNSVKAKIWFFLLFLRAILLRYIKYSVYYNTKTYAKKAYVSWQVVLAQLVERSNQILEIGGSNPAISN